MQHASQTLTGGRNHGARLASRLRQYLSRENHVRRKTIRERMSHSVLSAGGDHRSLAARVAQLDSRLNTGNAGMTSGERRRFACRDPAAKSRRCNRLGAVPQHIQFGAEVATSGRSTAGGVRITLPDGLTVTMRMHDGIFPAWSCLSAVSRPAAARSAAAMLGSAMMMFTLPHRSPIVQPARLTVNCAPHPIALRDSFRQSETALAIA